MQQVTRFLSIGRPKRVAGVSRYETSRTDRNRLASGPRTEERNYSCQQPVRSDCFGSQTSLDAIPFVVLRVCSVLQRSSSERGPAGETVRVVNPGIESCPVYPQTIPSRFSFLPVLSPTSSPLWTGQCITWFPMDDFCIIFLPWGSRWLRRRDQRNFISTGTNFNAECIIGRNFIGWWNWE